MGVLSTDDTIDFAGDLYDDYVTFNLAGSYQVSDNIAFGIGLSGLYNDGARTEITGSSFLLNALFPFAVSNMIDIVPTLGLVTAEVEFCLDNLCLTDDDNGVAYGIGLRAWAIPDLLEISGGIQDTTIDEEDSVVSLGAAMWWLETHSVRILYSNGNDSNTVELGYRYTW